MNKRFLILFICGLFTSLSATAQNSVTVNMYNVTNPSNKVIIKERHRDSLSTISCSNSKVNGIERATFIHSGINMTAREAEVENLYVNDMVIENDTLYFCGRHLDTLTRQRSAVIGYFDIGGVFFGPEQIVIESGFEAGGDRYPVEEFTRMVCFCREMRPPMHVACIGTCQGDTTYPCLVDLEISPFPVYSAGCVKNGKETFTDIKQVQNGMVGCYFLTAGYNRDYGDYINIRIYYENNFFLPSGPQNWCHVFCMGPSGLVRPWLDGGVLLAGIDGSTFATISYRSNPALLDEVDNQSSGWYANTQIHLATYKTSLIAYHSVYAMQSNYEIPLGTTWNRETDQFIYNYKTKSLAFLHSYESNPGFWKSEYGDFKLSSLSSSGTIQAYINSGVKQDGLSTYWNNDKYVLGGYDQYVSTTLKYQMHTFNTLSRCAEPLEYRYRELKSVESVNSERVFTVFHGVPNVNKRTPEERRLSFYKECESD